MRSITGCMLPMRSTNGISRRAVANREAGASMRDMSPVWPIGERWHLPMPDGTLYDALARAASRRPDHAATAFYGALLGYAELRRRVEAMAGFLQKVCGVKPCGRVLSALQNSSQCGMACDGLLRADVYGWPGT